MVAEQVCSSHNYGRSVGALVRIAYWPEKVISSSWHDAMFQNNTNQDDIRAAVCVASVKTVEQDSQATEVNVIQRKPS